jgi:hypothetical protein
LAGACKRAGHFRKDEPDGGICDVIRRRQVVNLINSIAIISAPIATVTDATM